LSDTNNKKGKQQKYNQFFQYKSFSTIQKQYKKRYSLSALSKQLILQKYDVICEISDTVNLIAGQLGLLVLRRHKSHLASRRRGLAGKAATKVPRSRGFLEHSRSKLRHFGCITAAAA
jgi:hypothetical protein